MKIISIPNLNPISTERVGGWGEGVPIFLSERPWTWIFSTMFCDFSKKYI